MTESALTFRVRGNANNGPVAKVVANVLEAAGLTRADEPGHLCWDEEPPAAEEFAALEGRYFNWLPGSDALAMNGRFFRALTQARARAEKAGRGERFDFVPRTYLLPDDVPEFHAAARRMPGNPFIWRHRALAPPGKAGILATPHDAGADARYLVQEYVKEPHLLDGYKYTLRFYIAVTSLDPLVVWISDDGFCRFASQPYSPMPDAWSQRFKHITTPESLLEDPTVSLSWQNMTLASYWARLHSDGLDEPRLRARIEAMLQTALVALREHAVRLAAEDKAPLGPGQFELFAADVTVDEAERPWILGLHAAPALSVGPARNLPVAAREEIILERIVKDLLTLAGALAPEAPQAVPSELSGLASWLEAREARRGSWQRLFPSATSGELLSEFEQLRPADLKLALLARPPERRSLVPVRAAACSLDGGLLVASEGGQSTLLSGPAAQVWQGLAQGEGVEKLAASLGGERDPAECERLVWNCLTDWFRAGLIGWEVPPARAACPPTRWNAARMYEVDGLRLLVRGGGPEIDPLLIPLLAPFERTPSGAPERIYDLVNHEDGWALFDSDGKRRWRGTEASLGPLLLGLIQAEAMRAACRLGAFEALFLRERRTLLVPMPGLFRGLAEALSPRGFETVGAPIFATARNGLALSDRASEDGLHANHLLVIEVDRARPEGLARCPPFAALQALWTAARDPAQLTPAGASTLAHALSRMPCDTLVAHSVSSAARMVADHLSGTKPASLEAADQPPKLHLAR